MVQLTFNAQSQENANPTPLAVQPSEATIGVIATEVTPSPLQQMHMNEALLSNEDMSFQERYELYLELCAQRRKKIEDTSKAWHDAVDAVARARELVTLAKLEMLTAKAVPAPRVPAKHDWEV